MSHSEIPHRFFISENPSDAEMKIVQKGLEDHNKRQPYGELAIPTPDISLVLKNHDGIIIGGVITSMLTGVMHLEVLWVEESYRNQGFGKALVLEAERIGKEKGYSASQTWTFSFQAPEFYQRIGYKIVGIFDGYTNDITEYVLLKKFGSDEPLANSFSYAGFSILEESSEKSMGVLHRGLRQYVKKHVGELREKYPGIRINLALKNSDQHVVGGLHAYTTLGAVHTECIWVDEQYRNLGYGTKLLMAAEKVAKKNECVSALATAYSFQSPEFFENLGYSVFGISDGYPNSINEFFLIKRF
ncbi:MAG: GNAT family N-acetyltransferase [Candidatus Heimdallarchaeota archaeon]